MFNDYLDEVFLMVIVTFVFSALIMPFTNKVAHHIGAIDIPKDKRRVHTKPIPKLGGLGIFASFLFGYMLFGVQSVKMNAVLIGSFILIITGIIDDIKTLRAREELLGQILAALTITLYGDILLTNITVLGMNIEFGIFAYPITIFFILGCTNVIRLIDGLDGLSSGISSIFYLTIGIIAFFQGRVDTLEITLAFIMLGSTMGFLVHNFNPARLFAGEAGSSFMGFIIAVISLLGYKGTLLTSFLVPILILGVPILDTLFAILRRALKGKPIFEADKEHLHHQFLKMNFSHRGTVLVIYAINLLFSLASIFYALNDPQKGMIIYLILLIIVIWFILHTSIISEKMSDKVKEFEQKHIKK
ncbi:MAG: undecaprenyl/decaprenyl-phosphate alpha-N-acetylglucosaminyl 1-phosphate transferase [Bacilli bacterium]|nr:undecaprenyl/decaprenyl-phosphate alpha-N-acetylglucosaminyl 1-phosphate transferase [Bacilli bacterium]